MKVKKSEILPVLKAVKPGLAKKESVEQATHFIFDGNNVITYNGSACVSHPFQTPFKCSVSGDEFFKLINALGSDEFSLELEGDELLLHANKTKAKFTTSLTKDAKVEESIRSLRSFSENDWKPLPNDFVYGVSVCNFAASNDALHEQLTCVYAYGDEMMGCDRSRASLYTLDSSIDDPVLIPKRCGEELPEYPLIEYVHANLWNHFRTSEGVVFSTFISGTWQEYPRDTVVALLAPKGNRIKLPKGIKGVVDTAKIMADSFSRVGVNLAEGKITIFSRKDEGELEITEDLEYSGDPLRFAVNVDFLSQILEHSARLVVGEDRAVFVSGKLRHVLGFIE